MRIYVACCRGLDDNDFTVSLGILLLVRAGYSRPHRIDNERDSTPTKSRIHESEGKAGASLRRLVAAIFWNFPSSSLRMQVSHNPSVLTKVKDPSHVEDYADDEEE